jgi:hypothetical protein
MRNIVTITLVTETFYYFPQMAHSVEFKADTTHEPVLASLAEETKKLLKKDATIFTPVLSKWHPQAAVISASLIHKLYGNKLVGYFWHIL